MIQIFTELARMGGLVFEQFNGFIAYLNSILSTPMLILVFATGAIMTVAFSFVQITYFVRSFRYIFHPEPAHDGKTHNISTIQAFLGALSTSMGNGSLAGMGVAMFEGGPGAAFWLFVLGFFTMVIRFAEIYASTAFTKTTEYGIRGGPMVYLSRVPGGSVLPYIYAFFALLLAVVTGNAMQCNSMTTGIYKMTALDPYIIATILFVFVLYVVLGGSERIMKFSDALAPIKVVLFLVATLAVLGYFYTEIFAALVLMVRSAFTSQAVIGGVAGHSVMVAINAGVSRTLSATEAGLGNAGILFGAAGNVNPTRSGIMSMASTFISTQVVCFSMMLVFVVSGAWTGSEGGMPMVISAYSTVFPVLGGWIATLLSVMFGMGVLVAYAFVGLECWLFLTHGRWTFLYYVLYCLMAFGGSLVSVKMVFGLIEFITIGLIFCNLYGLLVLLPQMKRGWRTHLDK
jgi:AGCS family alanine or glycine:cation symporter